MKQAAGKDGSVVTRICARSWAFPANAALGQGRSLVFLTLRSLSTRPTASTHSFRGDKRDRDGFMESSTSQRVELPFAFEEADMEHLVNLIGARSCHPRRMRVLTVLQRTC